MTGLGLTVRVGTVRGTVTTVAAMPIVTDTVLVTVPIDTVSGTVCVIVLLDAVPLNTPLGELRVLHGIVGSDHAHPRIVIAPTVHGQGITVSTVTVNGRTVRPTVLTVTVTVETVPLLVGRGGLILVCLPRCTLLHRRVL